MFNVVEFSSFRAFKLRAIIMLTKIQRLITIQPHTYEIDVSIPYEHIISYSSLQEYIVAIYAFKLTI